jgi:hypothetical protein
LKNRGVKAQSSPVPKRLIVMFTHNGCITTRFFPTKSHGALVPDDLASTSLKSLVPHSDKLLMPRGIRSMNEWTTTMVRGQGNDIHLQEVASFLTCQPVTPNSNDPFYTASATKFDAMPVGPSLDHVIAQQLSTSGTPLLMRVGNITDTPSTAMSYSAAQTLYLGLGSVTDIYSSLTGLFSSGSAMSPDTYRALRGQSAIDIFRDDLDTLERSDMSQSDRNKLEAWKALLDQTTSVMRSAQCDPDFAASLGLTQDNFDAVTMKNFADDPVTSKITASMDGADLYSNLAVLAAVCNANPVIVLKYPQDYVFKGIGLTNDSDSLAHRCGNASLTCSCMPGVIDMLTTLDEYYAQKFAYLVQQLDGIEEGDGTVLDNSAAVWFQDCSDGCAHNLNNAPIVQIGSCGGYFKTGWAVNVEDASADLTRGNSEAQCGTGGSGMANGVTQETGTDPKVANAPINKYFCNLMNALGVKAGPDGFPLKGGTAEVTKFGMYDKTEDFIGGGTNPPTIHDPGEFAELRANG